MYKINLINPLNLQDKINCNNINEIREERNVNSIYTGSTTSHAYVKFSNNPLEIFHYLCKKIIFTSSEHPKNLFPLCLKNSQFKRQPVSWLQLTFWEEQKDFSPLEWIIQFASVCPRVVEGAFDNEVLLEYLSYFLKSNTYISRSCLFKMVWRDVSF